MAASNFDPLPMQPTAPPRILIADDQPDILQALRLLLKGSGYGIETASSPASALAASREKELDASTGGGSIRSDFDVRTSGRINRHRLRGTIGGGGRALRVATGNGRITLERVAGR